MMVKIVPVVLEKKIKNVKVYRQADKQTDRQKDGQEDNGQELIGIAHLRFQFR
jgi:hypothetical protein